MVELREHPRFIDKAAQADLKNLDVAARCDRHRLLGSAIRERRREIFLQRHLALEDAIVRKIDDAEPAFADESDDLELVQPRPHRKSACTTDSPDTGIARAQGA